MSDLTIICVTYGHKKAQVDLFINSLLCQASPNWLLYMVHDGPNSEVRGWVESFNDPRVIYKESAERTGFWGHYNRRWMMNETTTKWLTYSNADNYYTPAYVSEMVGTGDRLGVDICMSDVCHHYPNVMGTGLPGYNILQSGLGLNRADFLSFIIKTDVMKAVGFNHPEFAGADGMILNEYRDMCQREGRQPNWHEIRQVFSVQN